MTTMPVSPRRDAIVIGVLFIISTTFSIAGMLVGAPVLGEPDLLPAIAANAGTVRLGAMILFVGAAVIPGMAIVFYPYLRRASTALALSCVVIRCFEAAFFLIGVLLSFGLVALAEDAAASGSATADSAGLLAFALAMQSTSYTFGTLLFFGLSAVVLSLLLWTTRLVPRWLSAWAFAGALLVIAQGLLAVFAISSEMLENTLFIPIAIQEMVFAVWLIFAGFDQEAVDALFVQ